MEYYSKQLNDNICRACLCTCKNIILMTECVESKKETLLEMFITLTNIEISDSSSVSLCLCETCSDKLNSSYAFLRLCQKSNDILLCSYTSEESQIEDISNEIKKEVIVKDESLTDKYEDHNVNNIDRRRCVKRPTRLVQMSSDEVSQAIEETAKSFTENTNCIKCDFNCSNSRALSMHVSHLHVDLKGRWCIHCNKEYENLTEHMQMYAHYNRKCRFCSKSFLNNARLKEHLLGHSDNKPCKCEICGRCFITERHLRVHLRIHSYDLPFECNLCKQSFTGSVSLRVHKSEEHNISRSCSEFRQNYCEMCNKNVRSLPQHNKKVHSGNNTVDYQLCIVCGKQYKSAAKLRLHMRLHTGEMPYECQACAKRFSTNSHLNMHLRTHSGERPHVCHVCGKGFSQSSGLNTHLKIHTGRTELCKLCGQKFCRPSELRLHLRKHTGEKPYVCKECKQAFVQRSHLTEHEKTHNGIRSYACKYCNKSFIQNSALKTHENIHIGNKPFKCTVCSYACRQSYSLRVHMKKHLETQQCNQNLA